MVEKGLVLAFSEGINNIDTVRSVQVVQQLCYVVVVLFIGKVLVYIREFYRTFL